MTLILLIGSSHESHAFGINRITGKAAGKNNSNKGRRIAKVITRDELPTLDLGKNGKIVAPTGISKTDFYLPTYTVLRSGPVSFTRRLLDGGSYEQRVYKYMKDFNEDSVMTAQGNVDAYLASADDWADQKLKEEQGVREIYDYGKPLPLERVILGSVWGTTVTALLLRVVYQLANGKTTIL